MFHSSNNYLRNCWITTWKIGCATMAVYIQYISVLLPGARVSYYLHFLASELPQPFLLNVNVLETVFTQIIMMYWKDNWQTRYSAVCMVPALLFMKWNKVHAIGPWVNGSTMFRFKLNTINLFLFLSFQISSALVYVKWGTVYDMITALWHHMASDIIIIIDSVWHQVIIWIMLT